MSRDSIMPELYKTKGVYWDPVNETKVESDMWFLLPHEIFHKVVKDPSPWLGLDDRPNLLTTLQNTCDRLNTPSADVAALGIWGDSAPYNTRDSLFLVVINALSGKHNDRSCKFDKDI